MALRDPDRTRGKILEVAASIFHQKGFKGTSLSDILATANVSKGALYHHFANKQELLYAVLDEHYTEYFLKRWQKVGDSEDPVEAIATVVDTMAQEGSDEEMCSGCPIHNIAAELASVDDEVRIRVDNMYKQLQSIIKQGLDVAQSKAVISRNLDTQRVSLLFMCSLAGIPQVVKSCQDREVFQQITMALAEYIRRFKQV